VLDDWEIDGSSRDDLLLLASELASNAVEHTSAGFTVTMRAAGAQARVDVYDTGAELPTLRELAAEAEHGRGCGEFEAPVTRCLSGGPMRR
jgi:hypothetical protein